MNHLMVPCLTFDSVPPIPLILLSIAFGGLTKSSKSCEIEYDAQLSILIFLESESKRVHWFSILGIPAAFMAATAGQAMSVACLIDDVMRLSHDLTYSAFVKVHWALLRLNDVPRVQSFVFLTPILEAMELISRIVTETQSAPTVQIHGPTDLLSVGHTHHSSSSSSEMAARAFESLSLASLPFSFSVPFA